MQTINIYRTDMEPMREVFIEETTTKNLGKHNVTCQKNRQKRKRKNK